MSAVGSQESVPAPTQAKEPVDGRLTFPPFPPVPQAVTIVPFNQFKERGIQIFASEEGDHMERDGLGIPTIELRVQHDTDICKTETKRKQKAKKSQHMLTSAATPGVRREWWEQWMEAEDLRVSIGAYNPWV
jgi:hypothetical protein